MNEPFQLERGMSISFIAENSPLAVELLSEYGLHCMSCVASEFDTLEQGAMIHGIVDEDLDLMIEEVNGELAK